jgi:hypothetical protein
VTYTIMAHYRTPHALSSYMTCFVKKRITSRKRSLHTLYKFVVYRWRVIIVKNTIVITYLTFKPLNISNLNSYKARVHSNCYITWTNYQHFWSNLDEVYSIQHHVVKFVSDLRHFGGFLRVPRFSPPMKLTATI